MQLIKDLLVSFKENIKSKSKNPFLGTYAIVWIIRNWRLIYSFFFFDSKTTRSERIEILASYYTYKTFITDLLWNILWALGALILSYLLINLSRLIVNLFEKRLTPYVYKLTDSDSIVLKEIYDKLKSEKRELEIKLELERDNKGKMQREITVLEDKIQEILVKKIEQNKEISPEKQFDIAPVNSTKPENILFNKLKNKKLLDNFLEVASSIANDPGWVDSNKQDINLEYYIKLGLIEIVQIDKHWRKYTLSENGSAVLEKIRLNL